MSNEWGPLAALAGEWQGTGGLDTAFSHSRGEVRRHPLPREGHAEAVRPGRQRQPDLYGLDYKSAMWRDDEENPFHTEVGYWLWDAATGEVMRGFVVPRGITVLAGGIAAADATSWTMKAQNGTVPYSIGENPYLAKNASTLSYEVTITIGDGTWSYDETTMLQMNEFPEPFAHTDHNTLQRVA